MGSAGRTTRGQSALLGKADRIQNVFILLGPTLFAATVYMTLGRIIRSIHVEQHSIVRVNWLTMIFVMGDVLSFLIQGTAGGLMASGSNASLGQKLVIAGLVIQVVMFALFIITAVIFQMRMRQYPTARHSTMIFRGSSICTHSTQSVCSSWPGPSFAWSSMQWARMAIR